MNFHLSIDVLRFGLNSLFDRSCLNVILGKKYSIEKDFKMQIPNFL